MVRGRGRGRGHRLGEDWRLSRGLPFLFAVGCFRFAGSVGLAGHSRPRKGGEGNRRDGASEFCIVAAVRGPDERLMAQIRDGVKAISDEVEINVACSLGILTQEQVDELVELGVHRYNHNLETARSFFPYVVTTHSYDERLDTCQWSAGPVCSCAVVAS